MAKPLAPERGLIKYLIKTPLTVAGAISMYVFGGGILSVLSALSHFFSSRNVFEAMAVYFITEYLPPTSLEQVILHIMAGTFVAGMLWYWKTPFDRR